WIKRARGLVICVPEKSLYGALQSLQVESGRSPLPLRVCNSMLPSPRHQMRPQVEIRRASRIGDSYEPSAIESLPNRNSLPWLLEAANTSLPRVMNDEICPSVDCTNSVSRPSLVTE